MIRPIAWLALSIPMWAWAAAPVGVVDAVLAALKTGNEAQAIQELRNYRTSSGVTPEFLEAESWLARVEYNSARYPQATQFAQDVYDLSLQQLKKRPLDAEKHLPLALGASIEVQAGIMTATNRRAEAVSFLQEQVHSYAGTSIQTRLQKNLLLLTLEGKPAPALEKIALTKGQPAMIFFWAHWCGDCKSEIPILKRIRAEFAPKGLRMLYPTQKYGYVAGGRDAAPAEEITYIEQVRKEFYTGLIDSPAQVSEANFTRYGASTTPTIVLVDRMGIVRLYHPGVMSYEDLRTAIERIL